MKKPPTILCVNPSGTDTEAGKGFIGFLDAETCVKDIMADKAIGLRTAGEVWVYQLKQVVKVEVKLKAKS
jgi:hypothetical protein